MIEPRLGAYDATRRRSAEAGVDQQDEERTPEAAAAESRGLRYALFGILGVLVIVLLATLPPGAPLRDPKTGDIIGNTPFMDSLLFIIVLFFIAAGIGYGIGAKTYHQRQRRHRGGHQDLRRPGRAGPHAADDRPVHRLLQLQQHAHGRSPSRLAELLERAAVPPLSCCSWLHPRDRPADFIIPGVVPKWAIFAPIFIPIFLRLGVAPQTVLAAYRIGDSPPNVLTPLMVYFPFIVTVAQRYRKDAGVGTIISLMLPYAVIMLVAWMLLFVLWFLLGVPLGPGYPIR